VLFDLDNPQGNEPFFHNIPDAVRAMPDLTRRNVNDMDMASARVITVADILYQDLTEVLKAYKKIFLQGAVQEKLRMALGRGGEKSERAFELTYFIYLWRRGTR